MRDYVIPAGIVHGVLWLSLALTIVSAVVNVAAAIRYRDLAVAPLFLPRGVLSALYAVVYAMRLSQPVKEISDSTSMLAFSLGIAAWTLVWIMPAVLYRPPSSPVDAVKPEDRP